MRCAVWGSPVDHSLSPVLHRAAYRALGLVDWTYDRRDVDERAFEAALAGLGPDWRGLSLTMPLKEAALAGAVEASPTARAAGAANTLLQEDLGWSAHNTDVEGIAVALAERGITAVEHAVVVGSGATARSALLALAGAGLRHVSLMVRADARADTRALAQRLELDVDTVGLGAWPRSADVVVSTVPPAGLAGAASLPVAGRERPCAVLDVVYGSGPTPLETAAAASGWVVVPGTAMLLHQAAAQVRLMTGFDAPLEVMRSALDEALGRTGHASPTPPARA